MIFHIIWLPSLPKNVSMVAKWTKIYNTSCRSQKEARFNRTKKRAWSGLYKFCSIFIFQAVFSLISTIINLYCFLCCVFFRDLRKKEFYLIGLQSACDLISSAVSLVLGIALHFDNFYYFCRAEHYDESYKHQNMMIDLSKSFCNRET